MAIRVQCHRARCHCLRQAVRGTTLFPAYDNPVNCSHAFFLTAKPNWGRSQEYPGTQYGIGRELGSLLETKGVLDTKLPTSLLPDVYVTLNLCTAASCRFPGEATVKSRQETTTQRLHSIALWQINHITAATSSCLHTRFNSDNTAQTIATDVSSEGVCLHARWVWQLHHNSGWPPAAATS